MKKKKILNIFVTMFIASNLMTNFTYANPVGTETEITNLNESDEIDEHDTSDMPDSNDGFNDESDDIHYDGNEDYSFLNENGEIDETDKTNKAEDLGILKKDILFEYAYHHRNSDEDYYTSNLNEKIKDFLISKNIDTDKVVFSNVQYDKNKKLFFVFLKVLEDGQNYFQYEFLPNKEYKLYFDTNYYYLTLQDKTLINLTEHDYKNRIFNYIKRKYNLKKITDYSDNNDIKEDTDLNKLYIQATVTTESNENKNIKIYFDFNAKKYCVEIRDKRNMFCSKDDTKINDDLEDVDLSKIDTVNVLHYNEDSFNPNDWKLDQIAINKNGCKVDGKSYFYLSENEYHDSDKKDVSKWLKSINEEYDILSFEEKEQNGYKYWIFNMKNKDRLIFKLVPNKIPDAIQLENTSETRGLLPEESNEISRVLYEYMKEQSRNVIVDDQIVVDGDGKATLNIYIGKNYYSYNYDLNDPEYYTKKTIRLNKLDNETFDIVDPSNIKSEKCEAEPCDDCVEVKPGKPSPEFPPNDDPKPEPKPEKPKEKEKPKYKPMVTKPIPKKPKKEDIPVVPNGTPKEEEKVTPSNLPKEKTSSSNLPKRNNENGVTGRVVSKEYNNNNRNDNPENKTNVTIVHERPIEDVNKNEKELKQNAYNNNDNIAGLPKTNEENREAVKTGDNLFTKLALFAATLSIFGLSYLPFLKKKKIEINSKD